MNRYIYILLMCLSICFSGCKDGKFEKTVREHLANDAKDWGYKNFVIESIEIRTDTIPAFFTKEILYAGSRVNNALKNLSNYNNLGDYNPKVISMEKGRVLTEDDFWEEIANFKELYTSTLMHNTIAVEKVAYVTCSYEKDGLHATVRKIVILNKDNPNDIKMTVTVHEYFEEEYFAIKFITSDGQLKTDPFGNLSSVGMPHIEQYILEDYLK